MKENRIVQLSDIEHVLKRSGTYIRIGDQNRI